LFIVFSSQAVACTLLYWTNLWIYFCRYLYQLPPMKPNHTCGGANTWADFSSSSETFCSAGSYCPTTTQKLPCSSGYYFATTLDNFQKKFNILVMLFTYFWRFLKYITACLFINSNFRNIFWWNFRHYCRTGSTSEKSKISVITLGFTNKFLTVYIESAYDRLLNYRL
jgi:hypothetical protein